MKCQHLDYKLVPEITFDKKKKPLLNDNIKRKKKENKKILTICRFYLLRVNGRFLEKSQKIFKKVLLSCKVNL